jgi:hypothetical protein
LIQAYSGKVGDFGGLTDSGQPWLPWGSPRLWQWGASWIDAVNDPSNALFLDIGPGDFLVHHAISLGVHTTVLILVKGALDARGSKLMPDKKRVRLQLPLRRPRERWYL